MAQGPSVPLALSSSRARIILSRRVADTTSMVSWHPHMSRKHRCGCGGLLGTGIAPSGIRWVYLHLPTYPFWPLILVTGMATELLIGLTKSAAMAPTFPATVAGAVAMVSVPLVRRAVK